MKTTERLAKRRRIPADLQPVLLAATQMANLCFNLSQCAGKPITARDAASMKQCQVEYDAAYRRWINP